MSHSRIATARAVLKANLTPGSYGAITPVPLPLKATYPHVTIQKITGVKLQDLQGADGASEDSILQFNVWSDSYDEADALRAQINTVMLAYSNSISGVVIEGCNHIVDRDLYDDGLKAHQLITRIKVWFS